MNNFSYLLLVSSASTLVSSSLVAPVSLAHISSTGTTEHSKGWGEIATAAWHQHWRNHTAMTTISFPLSLMKDENNLIICIDNCFSGNKSNLEKVHITPSRDVMHESPRSLTSFFSSLLRFILCSQWFGNPRFEFIRHDVTDQIALEVDQIYHLACPASPVFYQNNGIKTIKTNVLGTLNMLGLAKRLKARFLLTSTSEVYGDPDVHPQVEEYWFDSKSIHEMRRVWLLYVLLLTLACGLILLPSGVTSIQSAFAGQSLLWFQLSQLPINRCFTHRLNFFMCPLFLVSLQLLRWG